MVSEVPHLYDIIIPHQPFGSSVDTRVQPSGRAAHARSGKYVDCMLVGDAKLGDTHAV